jgi:glucokinase
VIATDKSLVAGVDLGGTKIETVVSRAQQVVGSARLQTPQTGSDDVLRTIEESIRSALQAASATVDALGAVGVGSPGVIGEDGSVGYARNVPGFDDTPKPLGPDLSRALGGVTVKVDNDVRVAVRGEWKRGAGRPYQDFMGVFVGTGIGGGLVLSDQLRTGRGAAGEIGHTLVKEGGRMCSCGQEGHLEAYAGRGRIEWQARRLQEKGHKTDLFHLMRKRHRDRVTSGVIAAALEHRDRVTEKLIEEAVWALGIAIANAQNLLDLEAFIIGGGLGDRLGAPFVERIRKATEPHLFVKTRPPVFLTTELGDLSGAVGAAVLAEGALPAAAGSGTRRSNQGSSQRGGQSGSQSGTPAANRRRTTRAATAR